jgi:hypothetical protein
LLYERLGAMRVTTVRFVRILVLVVALFSAVAAETSPFRAGDHLTHQRTRYLDFNSVFYSDGTANNAVFEPASLLLLGSGLCLVAAGMRRRFRQKVAASKS